MAKFQPGKSGNPNGRPKVWDGLAGIKPITSDNLKKLITLHFEKTEEELDQIINDKDSPSIYLLIASSIKKAIEKGDLQRAEYLFMRSLGRVTESVETPQPEPVVIKRANGEQVTLDVKERK